MAIKQFFKKTKLRKFIIPILLVFVAIVYFLTVSSTMANQKISTALKNKPASTKAIIQTEDESFEETLSSDDGVSYTKIGSDIYVVNYDDSSAANKAVFETYNDNENITTTFDTGFEIAGHFKTKNNVQKSTDVLPSGMTWREYADSVGKKLVAVIDTGVSEEYSSTSKNFIDEPDEDENGHGTAVAQTIIENSDGKAIIMSLKAMGKDGTGYMSDIMEAIQYAREQKVDIINMSISAQDNGANSAFKSLVKSAVSDGIKVVAAAGNYNTSSQYYIPANIDGVISVGAIDADGNKIKTSNFNATYYEEADSSSVAAAKIAGKLAAGSDLSSEKTDNDIEYDKYDTNSKDALDKIYKTKAVKFAFSKEKKETKYSFESFYDNGKYYYLYDEKGVENFFKDWPILTWGGAGDYYEIFEKDGNKFAIQTVNVQGYNCGVVHVRSNGHGQWWLWCNNQYDWNQYWHRGDNDGVFNYAMNTSHGNGVWTLDLDTRPDSGYSYRGPLQFSHRRDNNTDDYAYIDSWYIYINFDAYHRLTINPNGGILHDKNFGSSNGTSNKASVWVYNNQSDYYVLGTASKSFNKFNGFYAGNTQVFTKDGVAANEGTYWSNNLWQYNGDVEVTAKWSPYKVTVHFNGNGATSNVPGDQTFYYGDTTSSISSTVPKRPGYTFKTWSTKGPQNNGMRSDLDIPYNAGLPTYMYRSWHEIIGENDGRTLNLYAQWTENTYDVTFKPNDNGQRQTSTTATGTVTNLKDKKYTAEITIPEGYTKTGYIFTGWNTKPDGSGTRADTGKKGNYLPGEVVKGISVTKDSSGNVTGETKTVTLYAQWEPISYNITFDSNKETHVRKNSKENKDYSLTKSSETTQIVSGSTASQSQTFDKAVALTANGFKWEGHTFLGWSTDKNATVATWKDGNTASYNFNTTGGLSSTDKDNVTLYAIWRADAKKVTVDPVKGSGKWNAAGDPNQGGSSSVKKAEDSVNKDGTGNTKWGDKVILGEAIPENKDATVTYDVNTDDTVNIDKTSETVDWKFSKWTQNTGAHGILYNNSSRANDGSHDNGKQTYYIVQDTDDTVTANYYMQTVTLPTPTRDGYTFLGWYYDAACTDKVDGRGAGNSKYPLDANGEEMKAEYQTRGNGGDTFRTDGNVTIYARWQKNSYNYADTLQAFVQDDNGNDTGTYLRKIDATTLQPLKYVVLKGKKYGFTVGVYKNSVSDSNLVLKLVTDKGLYGKNGNLVAPLTTDANGWYKINDYLEDGTKYVVHEIEAAPQYLLDVDQTFVYSKSTPLQITVKDEKILHDGGELSITKVDEYSRVVANAEFVLKDETTNTEEETFVSDENGVITEKLSAYLTAGHRYGLYETKAPEGYGVCDPIYFTAPSKNGETMNDIVVQEKTKNAELQILKQDGKNNEPLEGARFKLYMKDSDGNLVECFMNVETHEWVDATKSSDTVVPMELTTDEKGLVSFKNLPLRANFTGTEPDFTKSYYVKEIVAPQGYNALPDIIEIKLPDDGSNVFRYVATDDTVVLTLEAGGNGQNVMILLMSSIMLAVSLGYIALSIRKRRNA